MKKMIVATCLLVPIAFYVMSQTKKTPPNASVQRGKAVYETTCIACHQPNGGGVPALNPPLIKTPYVLGDKTKLINIVLKGLTGVIEVNGDEYNNAMPGWPQLTDQQIADVLSYVRNSFGNQASLVTAAQVKVERAKVK